MVESLEVFDADIYVPAFLLAAPRLRERRPHVYYTELMKLLFSDGHRKVLGAEVREGRGHFVVDDVGDIDTNPVATRAVVESFLDSVAGVRS